MSKGSDDSGLLGPGGIQKAPSIPFLAELGALVLGLAFIASLALNVGLVFYTWVENTPASYGYQRWMALAFVVPLILAPLLYWMYADDIARFEAFHDSNAVGNAVGAAMAQALKGDTRVSVLVRALGLNTPLSEYSEASYRVMH